MVWRRNLKLLLGLSALVFACQNCTSNRFLSTKSEPALSNVRSSDGQVFDGKLRILHHLVDGYTCEGRLVPESVLFRDTQTSWHWIKNNPDKCAAAEKTITDGITYDEATKTAVFEGKTYVPPLPYYVSASEDPNLADENLMDGICADVNGLCSLRAAVEQSVPVSLTEAVSIKVASGTYKLTNTMNLWILTPDSYPVQITGDSPQTTILDGTGSVPPLFVRSFTSSLISIENLTFQNGHNRTATAGSAIEFSASQFFAQDQASPSASYSINNCIFQNNGNSFAVVYVSPNSGSLQVHRSQFINNTENALQFDTSTSLLVEDSNFSKNSSLSILAFKNSGTVMIRNSSFIENYGGPRLYDCKNCLLENISSYKNFSYGMYVATTSSSPNFNVTVRQATIYDNGSPVTANSGMSTNLALYFKDVTNTLSLSNSILAMPPGSSYPNCIGAAGAGQSILGTNNLINDSSCQVSGSGNIKGDPMLSAAAGNGGFTPTLMPQSGSPAINAGSNALCTALDQRGHSRAATSLDPCDMGAVETP
jgi:hypothetical protein